MAVIVEATRMQIDLRWSEAANALIIVLITTTAFPSRAICLIHKSIYSTPAHVYPAIIIIIVSLGEHECLISLERVLAWDKLVNHSIMRLFLILKRTPEPWAILNKRKCTNAQLMVYRSIYEFNNWNSCWSHESLAWDILSFFQHYN